MLNWENFFFTKTNLPITYKKVKETMSFHNTYSETWKLSQEQLNRHQYKRNSEKLSYSIPIMLKVNVWRPCNSLNSPAQQFTTVLAVRVREGNQSINHACSCQLLNPARHKLWLVLSTQEGRKKGDKKKNKPNNNTFFIVLSPLSEAVVRLNFLSTQNYLNKCSQKS